MTIQESIRLQENISKILNQFSPTLCSPSLNVAPLSPGFCDSIIRSFTSTSATYSNPLCIVDSMSQIQQRFLELYSNISYAGIASALKSVEAFQNNLLDDVSLFSSLPYQSLFDSLVNTLTQVKPYLPPDEKDNCEKVILPNLKHKTSARLTLSEAVSILSLLVSIFFGIIASMPDAQMERIIAQNEIIIEQQAEIIQLQKEDEALVDALNNLTNSINLLTDEIDLLSEEFKGADNTAHSPSQPDAEESQQQSSDTQN